MGDKSNIEWTYATWNPIVGCTIVSAGCTHCYAMKMADRIRRMNGDDSHYFGTTKIVKGNAVWTGRVKIAPDHIMTVPLRWKRPRAIFVNSMGDLFHEDVHDAWIDRVFAVMALTHQHSFVVLTKRAKRMRHYMSRICNRDDLIADQICAITPRWDCMGVEMQASYREHAMKRIRSPLPNVIVGVSAERQQEADERLPDLLATPAAKRIISAEPLLGEIDLRRWLGSSGGVIYDGGGGQMDYVDPTGPEIDGVIVGGESGRGARAMHPDWARAIRDQCAAADVPFFFKQWGEFREYDTGPPPHDEVDADSEDAEAIAAMAINPSWITTEGRHFLRRSDLPVDTPCRLIERVGKRAAGRLLDGREHNDLPWRVGA